MEGEMEESKNASKGLVAKLFAVKQPNPYKSDILDSIFQLKNQQGNAAHESPGVNNSAPTDTCFMTSSVDYGCRVYYDMDDNSEDYGRRDYYYPSSKQHPGGYYIGNAAHENPDFNNSAPADTCFMTSSVDYGCRVYYDVDDNSEDSRSNMSSSVDYGCRDNYPSSKQHPGGYDIEDRKDGNDYPEPEHTRGEMWEGSFYY